MKCEVLCLNKKFRNSLLNVVVGFGGQLILLALGIIVPRLILVNYGSEVNGLSNTINQIYTYVALLEAGIGQSALFSLYKSKSKDESSKILSATVFEYRKTAKIYAACVGILSLLLPFLLKSELPFYVIFSVTLLSGIPSLISFYYISAYMQLLTVEGKHYVETSVNLGVSCLSYIAKIILANLAINIVILYIAYVLITLLKTIIISAYIKKNYSWINSIPEENKDFFKDRKGFVRTQIAWIVFSNTDVILISFFCGLKLASVYAVYNLVYTSIYSLMNQIYAGVNFLLGHEYNNSLQSYTKLHDAFDGFFDMLVCSTMSICYLLTLPFIRLYTAGVTDVNYVDELLPLLFCCVQILTWIRYASGNLTSLAGYANKIGKISIIEAGINVGLTILFVNIWGIRGALFATIVALLFKSNYLLVFANKIILKRGVFRSYRVCLSNIILFICFVALNNVINLNIDSYLTFLWKATVVSLIVYILFYLYNLVVNRGETLYYTKMIVGKILKK
jgi:O-antigen/teichoic acid export membrane protein